MPNIFFEKAVEKLLLHKEVKDRFLASTSIHSLYDRIEEWAQEIEQIVEDHANRFTSKEFGEVTARAFKIQQVLSREPLHYFLESLSQDSRTSIRAAAKDIVNEQSEGMVDGDIMAMGTANFFIKDKAEELLASLNEDEVILSAEKDWAQAVSGELASDHKSRAQNS